MLLSVILTLIILTILIAVGLLILACLSLKADKNIKGSIWHDRKRTIFYLPLSFTSYNLTPEKFLVTSGIFNIKDEEIRLYRILDLTYKASFLQRLFGVGNIVLNTTDKTSKTFTIKNIKDARNIKELISDNVEKEREKKRVFGREYMVSDDIEDDETN